MIFIAKDVADGIRSWSDKPEVKRIADAIRNLPGVDVYARSIAGGLKTPGDSTRGPEETPAKGASPDRSDPAQDPVAPRQARQAKRKPASRTAKRSAKAR